jgi:hypothetical protein
MSREKDLIDLIRTANEVYLINPSSNVRTAYILIDDLCELIMKSFLQSTNKKWSPNHANGYFKGFKDISKEIKVKKPKDIRLENILTNIDNRRTNRNQFFHNHKMTGLTVNADNCLEAFCDLYDLLDILFPDAVKNNKTATYEAQTATIRVLKDCASDDDKQKKFNILMKNWEHEEGKKSLKVKGEVIMEFPDRSYQYCVIHYFPQRFYDALNAAGLIKP